MFQVLICFLLLTFWLCWAMLSREQYCALCTDHTMCRYDVGRGDNCKTNGSISKEMVHYFNYYRNLLARGKLKQTDTKDFPPAANMIKMVPDMELEGMALRWVQQCLPTVQRDSCRNISRKNHYRKSVVINVQQMFHVNYADMRGDLNHTVNSLLIGISLITEDTIRSYNPIESIVEDIEKSVALMWANSHLAGCVMADYNEPVAENQQPKGSHRVFCNFGNFIGYPLYTRNASIYKIGPHRSKCPSEYPLDDYRYPGLCVSKAPILSVVVVFRSLIFFHYVLMQKTWLAGF